MAAVKGANKTKYDAGGSGSNYIASNEYGGEVKTIVDTYEAAALADGSTIALPNLPVGAKIIGFDVYHDALGAGTTMSLGDSATSGAARYKAAAATTSAGVLSLTLADGALYEIGTADDDDLPILTTVGAMTGTIKTIISYV